METKHKKGRYKCEENKSLIINLASHNNTATIVQCSKEYL